MLKEQQYKRERETYFRTFLDKRYNRSAASANKGIFIMIEASKITAGGELLKDDGDDDV